MKSKDRITGYVCTSATGVRVPVCMTGRPKNSRCFRVEKTPVPYLSQSNAWANTVTSKKWFFDVFLPFIRRNTSRYTALVMDNCGPHGAELNYPKGQVTITTLPPNCASLHQPMDMGIISKWELEYGSVLIRAVVENLESRQQR